eukprot:NODE_257_length_12663_cov_0.723655.p1 type:complete len:488 gc:universal NODE_257_length_12663_cov_0.723655:576-2039(+)
MSQKKSSMVNDEMIPTMSLSGGIAMVAGTMIGSGIFGTPSLILRDIESIGVSLLLWAAAGLIAMFAAAAYVEWGMIFPRSGGEQTYLAYSFRKPKHFVAFVFCISSIILIRPGQLAAIVMTGSKNLVHGLVSFKLISFDGPEDLVIQITANVIVLLMTVVNIYKAELALKIQSILTYVKFVILLGLCLGGVAAILGYANEPVHFDPSNLFGKYTTDPSKYASALFNLLWVFDGWNNLNYAIGEMQNPKKDFPRAVFIGVTMVSCSYFVCNIFYYTVLPYNLIIGSEDMIAALYGERVFGDIIGNRVTPILVFLSCYGAADATLFSSSRLLHSAATNGIIPFDGVFKKINKHFQTPVNALLLNWLFTTLLINMPVSGNAFEFFIQLVSYPMWIFYGLTVLGLVILRYQEPYLLRPFKVPILCAIIVLAASVFLLVFPLLGENLVASLASLGALLICGIMYLPMRTKLMNNFTFNFSDSASDNEVIVYD